MPLKAESIAVATGLQGVIFSVICRMRKAGKPSLSQAHQNLCYKSCPLAGFTRASSSSKPWSWQLLSTEAFHSCYNCMFIARPLFPSAAVLSFVVWNTNVHLTELLGEPKSIHAQPRAAVHCYLMNEWAINERSHIAKVSKGVRGLKGGVFAPMRRLPPQRSWFPLFPNPLEVGKYKKSWQYRTPLVLRCILTLS